MTIDPLAGIPPPGESAILAGLDGSDQEVVTIEGTFPSKHPTTGEPMTGVIIKLANGQTIEVINGLDANISAVPLGESGPTNPIKAANADIAETPAHVEQAEARICMVTSGAQADKSHKGHIEISAGRRMSRILFYLLLIALAGFGANWWWQAKLDQDHEQTAREQRRQTINSMVMNMAAMVNADAEWKDKIVRGSVGKPARLLTAEVQEAWVKDQPILFVGTLEDVIENRDGTYGLVITLALLDSFKLEDELQISLICSEAVTTPVIDAAKKSRRRVRFDPDIAITGLVERVDTYLKNEVEGDSVRVIVGSGRCLSAAHLPNVFSR